MTCSGGQVRIPQSGRGVGMHSRLRLIVFSFVVLGLALPPVLLRAQAQQDQQQDDNKQSGQGDQQQQQAQPANKRPQETAKERRRREAQLHKELDTPYKKWLDEDVVYIITPEERSAFLHLQTNEEREQFIEQFWLRRNPDPGFARKHLQRRALSPHRLYQRTLRLGHSRLEDRSRPHLHHVGPAG